MAVSLLLLSSYLLGAVPFGYLIAKQRGVDIMAVGSGNIGATNVSRVLGAKLGLLVFVLDVVKGLLPALAGSLLLGTTEYAFACGLTAVAGHSLSPFLRFRGGKGVATALGALIGSVPPVAAVAFAVFLLMLLATRYVSLSSLVAGFSAPIIALALAYSATVVAILTSLAVFLLWRHRANLKRLLGGSEPKFSFGGPSHAAGAPPKDGPAEPV